MLNKIKLSPKTIGALAFFFLLVIGLNVANVATPGWIKEHYPNNTSMYAWMYVVMFAASVLTIPVWQSLAAKIGEKFVVPLCCVLYAFTQVAVGLWADDSMTLLFLFRIGNGAFGGPVVFSIARAAINTSASSEEKVLANNVGMVIAVLGNATSYIVMSPIADSLGNEWTFYIQGMVMGVIAIGFYLWKRNKPSEYQFKGATNVFSQIAQAVKQFKKSHLFIALLSFIPAAIVMGTGMRMFNLTIKEETGSTMWVAYFQLIIAAFAIPISLLIIPWLKRKIGLLKSMTIMLAVGIIFITLVALDFTPFWLSIILFAIYQASMMMLQGTFAAYCTMKIMKNYQGIAMGFIQSVSNIGAAIGMIIYTYTNSLFTSPSSSYFILVGIGCLSVIMFLFEIYSEKKNRTLRETTTESIK